MLQTTRYIQALVDTIESNLSEDINILQLSDSFHISPWYFQRLFKALVGDSLGGYVRGRRLTEAAKLLQQTDLRIIDIASRIGYGSHESFTRSFKANFGQTPKQFRINSPSVVLNEKPVLSDALVAHLKNGIAHTPTIKTVECHSIIGIKTPIVSPFVSNDAYCEEIYPSWIKLLSRRNEIKNSNLKLYYGVTVSESGTFTEDTLDFIAGIPVLNNSKVPEGMIKYTFPRQLIAMFKVASIDKDTVLRTMNYIYGYWLPNSKYTRGTGSDYELFDEKHRQDPSKFIDPSKGSYYVVPIVLR